MVRTVIGVCNARSKKLGLGKTREEVEDMLDVSTLALLFFFSSSLS